MMLTLSAVVYALYVAGASAAPAVSYQKFQQLANIPSGWVIDNGASSRVGSANTFELKIHLTQPNLADLESKAIAIATPGHALYGQHLSVEELRQFTRPADASVAAVTEWLSSSGFSGKTRVDNDWIYVDVTAAEAEDLLKTKYSIYTHETQNVSQLRTTGYSLPAALHEHVDIISPTTSFATGGGAINTITTAISARSKRAKVKASCGSSITPACLDSLYSINGFTTNSSSNLLGISGYLKEYAQDADMAQFVKKYVPKKTGAKYTCVPVNGGACTQGDSSNDFVEANLDVQYAIGLAYPVKTNYYSTAGSPPFTPDANTPTNTNEPYLDWLNYLLAQDSVPATITTSYGDDEQSVPLDYATTVCNLFMQLGARGASVLFSSGDSGPGAKCTGNDSKKTVKFQPNFPASCPWITSVGATVGVSPEAAIDFSSGGFSNYFGRPSYQDGVVLPYLKDKSVTKFAKYLNASGRAIPDISAQGSNFHVIVSGSDQLVSGTSASSPAVAGIISLINGDRIAKGRPGLGFLNPLLYGKGKSALNDITSGTSTGCSGQISGAGFAAIKGYDASTGLGTPDFAKLLSVSQMN